MCLLMTLFGVDPGAPLVVAANRDERLDRPASAMTVLADGTQPGTVRILGGRDEQSGGTWLAVNERGVVAGLTNRPAPEGADPAKRSRGELPLALASLPSAQAAVEDLAANYRPEDYNPAWLLVGDRDRLFYVDFTSGDNPLVQSLGPGVHVLENNPLDTPSAKALQVRSLLDALHLGATGAASGATLVTRLEGVLADHTVADTDETARIPEARAACVHSEKYGTRSSTVVRVPADTGIAPGVWFADGHPCTTPFVDAAPLWARP